MGTSGILFFISIVLILGGLLFIAISLKGGSRKINQDKYRCQWLKIESRFKRDDENTYTICIFEADKLLDNALRDKGLSGKTMGERMKRWQGKWTNGNGIWAAHKIRNQLAHETGAKVDYNRAKQALIAYKQALKDVGAI